MKRPLVLATVLFIIIIYTITQLLNNIKSDYRELQDKRLLVDGIIMSRDDNINDKEASVRLLVAPKNTSIKSSGSIDIDANLIICHIKLDGNVDSINAIPGNDIIIEGDYRPHSRARNYGEFDAYKYYMNRGIPFALNNANISMIRVRLFNYRGLLYRLREAWSKEYNRLLPNKEASIIRAMVLGIKSDIEEDTMEVYRRNGIAHLLAISGLHIALIGMAIFNTLRRCGMSVAVSSSLSATILISYGIMIGLPASTNRAIIMFLLYIGARVVGRAYDMLTGLSISALILIINNPFVIYEVGFQLSFGAIVGVALIYKAILDAEIINVNSRIIERMYEGLIMSVSISVTTLPLLAFHYFEYAFYSPIVNILTIPFMVILMPISMTLPVVGRIITIPCYIIRGMLWWFESISYYCQEISQHIGMGRYNIGRPQLWKIILYYIAIVLLIRFITLIPNRLRIIGLVLCIHLFVLPINNVDKITFLDVGQGDGIIIQTRYCGNYIIDCGSSNKKDIGRRTLIPYLKSEGVGYINAIFVTHADEDHINGIRYLMQEGISENIAIGKLILPITNILDDEYLELVDIAKENDIGVIYGSEGNRFDYDYMKVRCIYPGEDTVADNRNEYSLVLSVNVHNASILLTGDIEEQGERTIMSSQESHCWDILKVPHHGSNTSSDEEFIDYCSPKVGIVSCGINNRYGHPHDEVVDRYVLRDIPILMTAERGAITIRIQEDGEYRIYGYVIE